VYGRRRVLVLPDGRVLIPDEVLRGPLEVTYREAAVVVWA
jgi:hypothetical protein